MVSSRLLSLIRCPECHCMLGQAPDQTVPVYAALICRGCGRVYQSADADFLDLRPPERFGEQTKYLDASLHLDARHERVSPPLLGSKIRNDMLRSFLQPGPADVIIDLGCGSGRTLLWNRDWGAAAVGLDISPFFSTEARREVDLLLGDLRKLPFADGTFTKAYSLDVLEHLSPDALRGMLAEAARVLVPGGSLFVYTHVRKNAPIAKGLRLINRFSEWLDRRGLVDLRQEHLRKSDHINPLRDIPDLEQVTRAAGFRIARIRFYTPIVGGFVENILIRLGERVLARRAARRISEGSGVRGQGSGQESGQGTGVTGQGSGPTAGFGSPGAADAGARAVREARAAAKQQIARSWPTYAALRALSFAMKLDLLLFGRITSGPFFALLVKEKS